MLSEDPNAMSSNLRALIRDRQFWANAESLAKVLAPAKSAVKMVEARTTSMADVFLALIRMATAIKSLPCQDTQERVEFRKQSIQFYNKRWKEFDVETYILAYFLHPKFRGKGMRPRVFQSIIRRALEIWKKLGGGETSAQVLVAQIHNYDAFKMPYNFTYMENIETPATWWTGCKQAKHYLQKLALYLLSITPHSAGCERVFTVLNWLTQKRRSR